MTWTLNAAKKETSKMHMVASLVGLLAKHHIAQSNAG
jgi:hypothetical protein